MSFILFIYFMFCFCKWSTPINFGHFFRGHGDLCTFRLTTKGKHPRAVIRRPTSTKGWKKLHLSYSTSKRRRLINRQTCRFHRVTIFLWLATIILPGGQTTTLYLPPRQRNLDREKYNQGGEKDRSLYT